VQARSEDPLGVDFEHDAAQENPVEIAFEDRRRPVVPNRKHEDQRLRRQQAVDIALDAGAIGRRVEIMLKRLAGQDGIKCLSIEIAGVEEVAPFGDRRARLASERRAIAAGRGMGVNHKRAQNRLSFV
jgi:hypothetical protein